MLQVLLQPIQLLAVQVLLQLLVCLVRLVLLLEPFPAHTEAWHATVGAPCACDQMVNHVSFLSSFCLSSLLAGPIGVALSSVSIPSAASVRLLAFGE